MTNPGRDIKNKFSDFEPEVDDLNIEKSWDKIQYFLPQEKKRRGFFWFFAGNALKITLAVLIAILGIFSFVYLNQPAIKTVANNNDTTSRNITHETNETHETTEINKTPKNVETPGGKNTNEDVVKNPPSQAAQNPQNVSSEPVSSGLQNANKTETNSSESDPAIQNNKNYTSDSPSAAASTISKKKKQKKEINPFIVKTESAIVSNTTNFSETKRVVSQPSVTAEPITVIDSQTKEMPYFPLVPIPFKSGINDTNDIQSTPLSLFTLTNKRLSNSMIVEIFAGPVFTKSSFSINDDYSEQQKLSPAIGAGLVYQLKNGFQFNGHFIGNANKTDIRSELIRNKVLEKQVTSSSIFPGQPIDTAIYYSQVHSQIHVTSKLTTATSVGIGYEIYKRGRLGVDLFCQLALKHSSYNFDFVNEMSKDTFLYIRTPISAPLSNEISEYKAVEKHQVSVNSVNVLVGSTVSYYFTPRIAFIMKPNFNWQLGSELFEGQSITSETPVNGKVGFGETIVKLRQTGVMLNLGLRIKLY